MLFIPHICNSAYIGVEFSILICFYVFKYLCYTFILVHLGYHVGLYQRNPISKGIKKVRIKFLQE